MTMTDRTDGAELAQAVLLNDPDFLREIVERTVQTILEEEMVAHLGAERYERTESGAAIATGPSRAP